VNYHFRSKDALVAEALLTAMQSFVEDTDVLLARVAVDPHAGLAALFAFLLEGSLRFPGIVRALLHHAFAEQDYSGPFPRAFTPIAVRLRDQLVEVVPGLDPELAGRRTVAALSASLFPAFFGGLFPHLGPFASDAARRAYFDDLAASALAPVGTKRSRVRRRRGPS
jgi:AcrR family transcriptional regulator